MKDQSIQLLKEWNAIAKDMVNASYALDSSRCEMVGEKFNGEYYSRIHRRNNGDLILEERNSGSLYPKVWLIEQDFSDLEAAFQNRIK